MAIRKPVPPIRGGSGPPTGARSSLTGVSLPAIRAPVSSSSPQPEGILSGTAQAVLVEIAAGLEEVPDILAKYDIRPYQLKHWLQNKTYIQMLREAKAKFAALGNTGDRIKIKAQLIVEMGLPVLHDMLHNPNTAAAARVSAFTAARALTGLEKPEAQPPGAVFKLEINIGEDAPPIVIEGETTTLHEYREDQEPDDPSLPSIDTEEEGEYEGN